MSRVRRHFQPPARMAGLSLIEMMVALVMALIVAAGIITVFQSTSSSNKVQAQLATLQEAGRFAIHSLRTDLGNANGAYCSNTGGSAVASGSSSGLLLDSMRAPIVYATAGISFPDNTVTAPLPAAPTQPYVLPSSIYMRGYDCDKSTCTPEDPNVKISTIPAMGTDVGDRVVGADVLTIRYLKPDTGWAIMPPGSATGTTIDNVGGILTVNLKALPGEPPVSRFVNGDLAMLATCSQGGVYAVSDSGNALTFPSGSNSPDPIDISQGNPAAPRVFDFTKDFQTVTYFLRVVQNSNGHKSGELVQRVNGIDQPLVRGVERLDFEYGIIDANGNTRFLTANEVDTATDKNGNAIPCPPGLRGTNAIGGITSDPTDGCLWRAVQNIQVHILMDGQTPLYTMTPNEIKYIYSPDGDAPTDPSGHAIKPYADQGFPKELLRREFTTMVALRNFNP